VAVSAYKCSAQDLARAYFDHRVGGEDLSRIYHSVENVAVMRVTQHTSGGIAKLGAPHVIQLDLQHIVDAANTLAVFVWGPERIKLEYVEHKASFSLV
jgi:hypothetical protein